MLSWSYKFEMNHKSEEANIKNENKKKEIMKDAIKMAWHKTRRKKWLPEPYKK